MIGKLLAVKTNNDGDSGSWWLSGRQIINSSHRSSSGDDGSGGSNVNRMMVLQ